MTVTISRLYDDPYAAHRAVNDLEAAGIPSRDISIVASNADEWYDGSSKMSRKVDRDADGADDRAEGAGVGAGIGATLGGAAGLLAGLGLMAIPGLGPVVAAGWLAATAAGAVAGGATGGIIGALTQSGVSKTDAEVYAEGVRRGGTLVTARVPDGRTRTHRGHPGSGGRQHPRARTNVARLGLDRLRSQRQALQCRSDPDRTRNLSRADDALICDDSMT